MKNILLFHVLIVFTFHANADITTKKLFETISMRLGYMESVALYKAKNNMPIEDVEREKTVINQAKLSAAEKGVSPDHIEDFFKAQISVAKAIQFRYRADLLSQPRSLKLKDLNKEIRPELIQLGDLIITEIVGYLKVNGSFEKIDYSDFESKMNIRYVKNSDKKLIFNSLKKIKLL